MAAWAEFAAQQPRFATRVRRLMTSRKHLTMATLRRDGSPRISGTEVRFTDGELQIGSMPGALKALDLLRDPRVAIHGPTHDARPGGRWRGEAKVAGTAIAIPADGDMHAFRIDIREAVITRVRANRLVIESWTPSRGLQTLERD